MEFKKRWFPFSYILGILEVIYLFQNCMSYPTVFVHFFFVVVLILKSIYEGFRVNIFCLFFVKILDLFQITLFSFIMTIVYFYLTFDVVVYKLPDEGPPIGYKWIKGGWIEKFGIPELAMFYPTNESNTKTIGSKWLKVKNYAQRMVDTTRKDQKKKKKVPYLIFWVLATQFYKVIMNVYENASINLKQARQYGNDYYFPVIILSHGLASHCNGYSVFARFLAQQGYIVVCPEHIEYIRNIYPSYEENRIFRRAQLYERFKTIKSLLDIICNGKLFEEIQSNVKADQNEISIIGHSFGGSTAIFSAFNDKRITGACVAYDPCLYIFDEQIHDRGLTIPIMSIMAEDFYHRLYPYMKNDEKIQNFFDNIKYPISEQSILLYLYDQQHADFSDLVFVWNGESKLYKVSRNLHEVHIRFGMIMNMTMIFLRESMKFHMTNENQELKNPSIQKQELKSILLDEIAKVYGEKRKNQIIWRSPHLKQP